MSTPQKTNGAAQGTATAAKNNNAKTTVNRPNIPGKEKDKEPGNNETAKPEPAAPAAQASPATAAEAKAPADEQKAPGTEQPKGEEIKDEPKAEVKYIKPAMNLEQTVKVVESLNRKNIQRLALIARIKTLEGFQIQLAENGDQLETNIYQGCKLIIEDDRGNKFTTNTPNLIAKIAQFVYDTCVNRLTEIEAEIVFPNA